MGRKLMRWARADLLWSAVGFLAIQLVLGFCVEAKLPQVRDPEFADRLERLNARQAEMPDRPLVVALGSSRTQQGLDAGWLSSNGYEPRCLAFNLGLDGAGPMMQRIFLQRLREADLRPDLLIVEVMPAQLLSSDHLPFEDRWLDGARLRSSELSLVYPFFARPSRQLKSWLLGRSMPCSRHQAELRGLIPVDQKPDGEPITPSPFVDAFGWKPAAPRTPEKVAANAGFVPDYYGAELRQSRIEPCKLLAFRELLDECRREGIPTALVWMPEPASLRALYPDSLKCELAGLLDGLREEYQLLALIDARTWVEDAGFYDGMHLDSIGARAFTKRFGDEGLQPLLKRTMAAK